MSNKTLLHSKKDRVLLFRSSSGSTLCAQAAQSLFRRVLSRAFYNSNNENQVRQKVFLSASRESRKIRALALAHPSKPPQSTGLRNPLGPRRNQETRLLLFTIASSNELRKIHVFFGVGVGVGHAQYARSFYISSRERIFVIVKKNIAATNRCN